MASAGPAEDTDVQVMSKLPIAEWWLMALLHGALQLHPCDIEIAQSPGMRTMQFDPGGNAAPGPWRSW